MKYVLLLITAISLSGCFASAEDALVQSCLAKTSRATESECACMYDFMSGTVEKKLLEEWIFLNERLPKFDSDMSEFTQSEKRVLLMEMNRAINYCG